MLVLNELGFLPSLDEAGCLSVCLLLSVGDIGKGVGVCMGLGGWGGAG